MKRPRRRRRRRQVTQRKPRSRRRNSNPNPNPSDLGRIDFLGHTTGTWDRPMRWLDSGVRHSVADPGERLEQLGPQADEDFKKWVAKRAPAAKHSHFPDDDAEYNYWQMVYCNEQQ